MKQYIYSPGELGLAEWQSGTLRLEGIAVTTNPDEADVFVIPGNMSVFKEDLERVDRLPYMQGREDRHICFDVSDNFTQAINRRWVFIKCDARSWMLKDDPNTVNLAWPVGNFLDVCAIPEGGFRYDVTFRGWLSSQPRIDSARSCKEHPALKTDIVTYDYFTGYIGTVGRPEYDPAKFSCLMDEFKLGMRESRVCLCPESIPGVFPYRFFEAMSAGRVPVLVASDVVFPFRDEIPYEDFIIHIERNDAPRAGEIVREFLDHHDDLNLTWMGDRARGYWEKYLDSRNWPKLMSWAVQREMQKMGLTQEIPVLCT